MQEMILPKYRIGMELEIIGERNHKKCIPIKTTVLWVKYFGSSVGITYKGKPAKLEFDRIIRTTETGREITLLSYCEIKRIS